MVHQLINRPRYYSSRGQRYKARSQKTESSYKERWSHAKEEQLAEGAGISPEVPSYEKHAKASDNLKRIIKLFLNLHSFIKKLTNCVNFKIPGKVLRYPVFNIRAEVLVVVVVVRVIVTAWLILDKSKNEENKNRA